MARLRHQQRSTVEGRLEKNARGSRARGRERVIQSRMDWSSRELKAACRKFEGGITQFVECSAALYGGSLARVQIMPMRTGSAATPIASSGLFCERYFRTRMRVWVALVLLLLALF